MPWLPYWEQNRVIINSHNFTPATFDPSVNGKTPIACWCPSKDTAGNGTTTLTDLAGSNNGTLTNMDATTDWVADTGSGGVRALDFDGVNDCVRCGTGLNTSLLSAITISGWFKFRNRSSVNVPFSNLSAAGQNGLALEIGRTANKLTWLQNSSTVDATSTGTITDANWHHVVVVRTGSTGSWTIKFYIDNTSSSHSTSANPVSAASNGQFTIARYGDFTGGFNSSCIVDDLRIWNQGLDDTDVSHLWNSGAGRGISA
jgi:hypothetical protein